MKDRRWYWKAQRAARGRPRLEAQRFVRVTERALFFCPFLCFFYIFPLFRRGGYVGSGRLGRHGLTL